MAFKSLIIFSFIMLRRKWFTSLLKAFLLLTLILSLATIIPTANMLSDLSKKFVKRTTTLIIVYPDKEVTVNPISIEYLLSPYFNETPISEILNLKYFFTEANVSEISRLNHVAGIIRGLYVWADWIPGTEKWLENQYRVYLSMYQYLKRENKTELLNQIFDEARRLNMTLDEYFRYRAKKIWLTPLVLGVDVGEVGDVIGYFNNIIDGRFIRLGEDDAIVVSIDLILDTGVKLGDVIKLKFGNHNYTFRIVGVLSPHRYTEMVMSLSRLMEIIRSELGNRTIPLPLYSVLFVKVDDPIYVLEITSRIRKLYPKVGVYSAGRATIIGSQLIESLKNSYNFISYVLMVLTIASLIALHVIDAFRSRREVGLLKAMGWSNLELTLCIFAQSLIIGFASGLTSIITLSITASQIRSYLMPRFEVTSSLHAELNMLMEYLSSKIPDSLITIYAPLIGMIMSLLANLIAYIYYLKLNPADTLREV